MAPAEREPVALRIGRDHGPIVVDVGGPSGRCVIVSPSGWTVEEGSPVLFRRSELTGALPVPERGGSLATYLPGRHNAVRSAMVWARWRPWLVFSAGPYRPGRRPLPRLGHHRGGGTEHRPALFGTDIDAGCVAMAAERLREAETKDGAPK